MSHINAEALKAYRADDPHKELTPIMEFWRDERLIAIVTCVMMDRDDALTAIDFLVPTLDADHISLVLEGKASHSGTNPDTGKPWVSGEIAESPATKDVLVSTWASGEEMEQGIFPFENVGGVLIWEDDLVASSKDDDSMLTGYVPEVIQQAFQKKEALRQLTTTLHPLAETLGIKEEEARVHIDCVALKSLMATGMYVVAIGAYPVGDPRNEVIVNSMRDSGLNLHFEEADGE